MLKQLSLYISLFLLSLIGATEALATPRLTVVVAVDGMSQQDLNALRPFWPQGGLRNLSEEAFQTNLELPNLVYGGAETPATLFSGVTPDEHILTADYRFDRSERKVVPVLQDPGVKGIGTSLRISPQALRSMFFTDRFRLQYGKQAGIYAIGLDPNTTICMAGHSANACCWFDAEQLRWVTTSFYAEGLPSAADKQNTSGRIAELAAREWTPRMDIAQYLHPTDEEKKRAFSYTGFQGGHAPAMNSLVADLALALQKDRKLGEDPTPDLLFIQMTVRSPKAKADAIATAEQEDMYLSLNQDLGFLQEQLTKRLGKDNYQLLVVGLPRLGATKETLSQSGLAPQPFNIDRAVALLGTYLMAIYGHERWVDGGFGQSIFLNRTLIEQKKLSLHTIRRQVSEFLLEFDGVQGACPMDELLLMRGNSEVTRLQQSLNKQSRGDVVFWLEENRVLYSNDKTPFDLVIDRNPHVPLLLWSGSYRNYPDPSAISVQSIYSLLIY